jgi:nicotinate-nucleotide adenylyltransferase
MWFAGPAPETSPIRSGLLRPGLHLEPGQRVGLLGGSFNPAHAGHAHIAETALRRLGLDRVIWLVSPQNPLKSAAHTAPLDRRMASARQAARGPSMIVSDLESRMGTRYTIDTVRALKARFPGVRFVWLMGSDNLQSFHRWRGWTELFRLLPIAVVARPGRPLAGLFGPAARRFASARTPAARARLLAQTPAPAWVYLNAPLNPTSSTAIRSAEALRNKRSAR